MNKEILYLVHEKMIYLFGDTYPVKEKLKILGFKWVVPHWKKLLTTGTAKHLNSMFGWNLLEIGKPKNYSINNIQTPKIKWRQNQK